MDTGRSFNELAYLDAFAKKRELVKTTTKPREKIYSIKYEDKDIKYIYDTLTSLCPDEDFWEQVIFEICNAIKTYEFNKTSSVRNVTSMSKDYHNKKRISLLKHTRHILQVVADDISPNGGSIGYRGRYEKYIVAIAGVLHDFGKSKKLTDDCRTIKDGIDTKKHAAMSFYYINEKLTFPLRNFYLESMRNTYRNQMFVHELFTISEAVRMHHNGNLSEEEPLALILQQVDKETREYEDILLSKNKVELMEEDDG